MAEGTDDRERLAEAVRQACIRAALEGYERGGIAGLCAEGRWEMAVDALRALDIDAVIRAPREGSAEAR